MISAASWVDEAMRRTLNGDDLGGDIDGFESARDLRSDLWGAVLRIERGEESDDRAVDLVNEVEGSLRAWLAEVWIDEAGGGST